MINQGSQVKCLANHLVKRPRLYLGIILTSAVLAVVGMAFFPGGNLTYHVGDFEVDHSTSSKVGKRLARSAGFAETPAVSVLYPIPREQRVREALERFGEVAAVGLESRDQRERIIFALPSEEGISAEELTGVIQGIPGAYAAGPEIERVQAANRIHHDLVLAELLALPLILLWGYWFFRKIIPAVLPLLGGIVTLMLGLGLINLANALHPLSIFSLNVAVGLGVGLSLDYSLLLVSRVQEQLRAGEPAPDAVFCSLRTAGRTIAISSGVVTAAFGTLLLFPIELLRSTAVTGMIVAATAGFVALTALPVALLLLWRHLHQASDSRNIRREKDGWYRIASTVMKRPLVVALGAAALILTLAAPALNLRIIGLDISQLPLSRSTQHFYDETAKFPAWTGNNIQLIQRASTADSRHTLKQSIVSMPGVLSVSFHFIEDDVWGAAVAVQSNPFGEQSVAVVEALEKRSVRVGGVTASYLETTRVIEGRLPLVLGGLAASLMALTLAATWSLLLPPKTFLMNMLSLAVGFGVLVVIFQQGHGASLFGIAPQAGLPLVLPVVITVGAFGLLTDYSLFVLLRIKEEWDNGHSNRDAIAFGLQSSGRVVTVAALMFCTAVGMLVTSQAAYVKEAAVGLATVIAVDASIVRLLLVPSLMALLGRWNWWFPLTHTAQPSITDRSRQRH